jgi:hypothetical protein
VFGRWGRGPGSRTHVRPRAHTQGLSPNEIPHGCPAICFSDTPVYVVRSRGGERYPCKHGARCRQNARSARPVDAGATRMRFSGEDEAQTLRGPHRGCTLQFCCNIVTERRKVVDLILFGPPGGRAGRSVPVAHLGGFLFGGSGSDSRAWPFPIGKQGASVRPGATFTGRPRATATHESHGASGQIVRDRGHRSPTRLVHRIETRRHGGRISKAHELRLIRAHHTLHKPGAPADRSTDRRSYRQAGSEPRGDTSRCTCPQHTHTMQGPRNPAASSTDD